MECKTAKSLVNAYIEGSLNDQDCIDFLAHVKGCRDCYDELETYFIVDYALQYLDTGGDSNRSFDMQKLLKDDVRWNEKRILRTRMVRGVTAAGIILSEILLVITGFIKFNPGLAKIITHHISILFSK